MEKIVPPSDLSNAIEKQKTLCDVFYKRMKFYHLGTYPPFLLLVFHLFSDTNAFLYAAFSLTIISSIGWAHSRSNLDKGMNDLAKLHSIAMTWGKEFETIKKEHHGR